MPVQAGIQGRRGSDSLLSIERQQVTLRHMILGFRHRGLRRLHERGNRRRLPPAYVRRIADILTLLNDATRPEELNLPGYGLHRLSGNLAGFWSVTVSRNWRIVFRFEGSNATDVNLVDYH